MKNIAKDVSAGYARKYIWVALRSSKPTNKYDIPRWHTDGNYFLNPRSLRKQQSKFITIFKGAGTLMIHPQPSKEVREQITREYRELFKKRGNALDQYALPFRKKLDDILAGESKKQLKNNEGLVFMV
jgi:hypothetical protein